MLDRYKSKGLPLMWTVGPTSEPDDLGDYLLKHKLMHVDTYTKMTLDLDAFQSEMRIPDGLEILEVTGKDLLNKWFNIYSVSFELSRLIEKALKKFYAGIFLDKSGRRRRKSEYCRNKACPGSVHDHFPELS